MHGENGRLQFGWWGKYNAVRMFQAGVTTLVGGLVRCRWWGLAFFQRPRFWRRAVCFLALMASAGGCGGSVRSPELGDLQSGDVVVRVRAMRWAADNGVAAAKPFLVDDLESEDEAIRFFAIAALRRLSGTDYGYDFKANAAERAGAVERWRRLGGIRVDLKVHPTD